MDRQPLPLIQYHLMGQMTSQAVERSQSVGDVSAFAAATANESLDLSSQLELDNIRDALIRQEDTIIFCVIERAQFAANGAVYQPDAVPVPEYAADGSRYSLLEYILRQTEQIHGRIRRFTSPDEHAFYPDSVPALVLPPLKYPEVSMRCTK
jgi:chorismate mutase